MCVTSTLSAAIARSESISGKRGLPGGGATTGSAADTAAHEHTLGRVRLPDGFMARLAPDPRRCAGRSASLYTLLVARKIAPYRRRRSPTTSWARTIADGNGWVRSRTRELASFASGARTPSAEHPPLFSLVLAGF